VHAFDHRVPREIARQMPGIQTGILSASYVLDFPHMIRTAGAHDLWQHSAMIDADVVLAAHEAGARVVAWTENGFSRARELASMGVASICTDIPGALRQALTPR
jgi:glycerophosphoryl diester phosphodiesterase